MIINQIINALTSSDIGKTIAKKLHADQHASGGSDPITPAMIGADVSGAAESALIDAKAYTDNKVSELVASAPETLDTLNELSAALNNDADFGTTVVNELAGKAPLSHASQHASGGSDPITPAGIGAADASTHTVAHYSNITDAMGLSDDNFSPTDVQANLTDIYNAMATRSEAWLVAGTTYYPNLYASLASKFTTDTGVSAPTSVIARIIKEPYLLTVVVTFQTQTTNMYQYECTLWMGSTVVVSKFVKVRDNTGFLGISGGKMTGNLSIEKSTPCILLKDTTTSYDTILNIVNSENNIIIQNRNYGDTTKTQRRQLNLANSDAATLNNAFRLIEVDESGNAVGYDIYGEHNKPTPADIGAASDVLHEIPHYKATNTLSDIGIDSSALGSSAEDLLTSLELIYEAMAAINQDGELWLTLGTSQPLQQSIIAKINADLGTSMSASMVVRLIKRSYMMEVRVMLQSKIVHDKEYSCVFRYLTSEESLLTPFSVTRSASGFVSKSGDTMTDNLLFDCGTGSVVSLIPYNGQFVIRNQIDSLNRQDVAIGKNGSFRFVETIDGTAYTYAVLHTGNSFGVCSTEAATIDKTVTCGGFLLVKGARIAVQFTVTNTATSPTLNVNSTGAKPIYYRGAAITAGYLAANRIYEFVFDGTNYELVGDLNVNTYMTQTVTTTNADYPILATYSANRTSSITSSARFGTKVKMNPGTGTITATYFNGAAPAGTDYETARVRSIYATTTDLTAGTTSLANGSIALVYE